MKALAPHWGALFALALFLVVGLAVLDDYGVGADEPYQRSHIRANLRYVTGTDVFLDAPLGEHDKFVGMGFEAVHLIAERAFGLDEGRGAHLARHLLMRLFFLIGGLFAYLLAYRLFGARLIALFAMLLILSHPRLHAHSFFSAKDIPFLVAFIVAIYATHSTFRRDRIAAFALLGAGVGALMHLRIMGVVLLAAIPTLRALDFAFASGWAERKRILLTSATFILASGLSVYALLPNLWADPFGRAVEWWTAASAFTHSSPLLFRGMSFGTDAPAEYLPVWLSITSPPFALPLGLTGLAAILAAGVKAPRGALRNTRLRFGLLLAAMFALPALAVVTLSLDVFNGWRYLYFIWAPFALLTAWGLRWLTQSLRKGRVRAAAYGAASAGLAASLVSMALIHPNQQAFFNFFVDRAKPEHLRSQYIMEYSGHSTRQALEWLSSNARLLPVEASTATGAQVWATNENAEILPDAARARFAGNLNVAVVPANARDSWSRSDRTLHRLEVYGNTILIIERKDGLQAVYAATRGREPDAGGAFDVHRLDDAVALAMEPCAPAFIERVGVTMRVTPVDQTDLPRWRAGKRDEPRSFSLLEYGAFFDGKCVASLPLPDYPVADFRLVQRPELLEREAAREAMRRARENGRLLARAGYDVYIADGELVYVQEPYGPLDTEHPFRVSVFPKRADDLPEGWRGRGHQRFWFDFHQRGALLEEGTRVALFPLPDYPIAAIRTGQFIEDGEDLWEATFSTNPDPYTAAYRAVAGSAPLARGAFDVHLLDGDLVYVKEPCEQADTEARFFLHVVPDHARDLPEERKGSGFDNLDFQFFLNGTRFDGRCVARVPLPPYPIASVRTGQFGSTGEIWRTEFAVGE